MISISPGCVLGLLLDHHRLYLREAAFVVETGCGDCLVVCSSDKTAALHSHDDLSVSAEVSKALSIFFGLWSVFLRWDIDKALHFVAEQTCKKRTRRVLHFKVKLHAFDRLDISLAAETVDEHSSIFSSFSAADRARVVQLLLDEIGDAATV